MKQFPYRLIGLFIICIILLVVGISQIPAIHSRLAWRYELAQAFIRGVLEPAGSMPTALPQPGVNIQHLFTGTPDDSQTLVPPTSSPQLDPTSTSPAITATPLPVAANLTPPKYEKQDQNNCGPATLTMYLRFYGWTGNQYDISDVVKPVISDKNVNVDELVYFVRTHVGWLNADYRVGGNITLLKSFLAAGMPIMIEESSPLDKKSWPDDDLWAGHYLLLTGYDDSIQNFTVQDSWIGPNLKVPYTTLDSHWQAFNRVYIPIYLPDRADQVQAIIGPDWDEATDRKDALATAQAEANANPSNGFAWFNVGTNLLYFDRYTEAALAYDVAIKDGLPQRMLRYQFGPFIAYFHTNRADDLMALSEYALKITPDSQEDLLWHGWAFYLKNDRQNAIQEFQKALKANPNYADAKYALDFLGVK
jgi:hypothetical protein